MQGRSLVPILQRRDAGRLAEELVLPLLRIPVPHHVRPHYGVITDRYKLVHYYKPDVDDWELLGPPEADPLEVKNFYHDPAYADTVKELHAELERLRKEVKETEDAASLRLRQSAVRGRKERARQALEETESCNPSRSALKGTTSWKLRMKNIYRLKLLLQIGADRATACRHPHAFAGSRSSKPR